MGPVPLLPLPDLPVEEVEEVNSVQQLSGILANLNHILMAFAAIVASVGYAYVGYLWISSIGFPENAKKAKRALIDVTIGVVLVYLSGLIVGIIRSLISPRGI